MPSSSIATFNLVGRHLPLAVVLRDHRLFDAVAAEQPDARQLWRYAAAADIIAWRHQVLTDLHHKGVLSVDVFPEQLTAPAGEPLPGDQGPAPAVTVHDPPPLPTIPNDQQSQAIGAESRSESRMSSTPPKPGIQCWSPCSRRRASRATRPGHPSCLREPISNPKTIQPAGCPGQSK